MEYKCIVVYVTAGDAGEAETIAKTLVFEKLAACVNIVDKIRSIYYWDGRINDETEFLLVIKTTEENFGALERRIKELHSYQIPEIIALPVVQGSKDYLNWLVENSHQPKA
jgi:periplasmic divalent cation tolerance protein